MKNLLCILFLWHIPQLFLNIVQDGLWFRFLSRFGFTVSLQITTSQTVPYLKLFAFHGHLNTFGKEFALSIV
jgi:hypothetical protein